MLQWLPAENLMFSGSMLGSKASYGESLQGAKGELRTSMALPGSLNVDLSAAKYSADYREFTEAKDFEEFASSVTEAAHKN